MNYKRDKYSRSELQNRKSIWQGCSYRTAFRYKDMCYPDGVYHIIEQPGYWARVDPEAFKKDVLAVYYLDNIVHLPQNARDFFMSETS